MTIKPKIKGQKTNNTTSFMLRLVMSYSIILVIILIMGLYLYNIGINDAKQTQYLQNKFAFESCITNFDTTLNNMAIFTSQIAQSSTILRLGNMSNEDDDFIMTGYNAMEILSNQLPTEMLLPILRYYVYLPNSSYCLSSSVFCAERNYYIDTQNAPLEYMDYWSEIHTDTSSYMKLVNMNDYVPKENNTYMYIVPLSTYTLSKNYNSVACFQLSEATISSYFSTLPLYDSGFILVVDEDGNEVFSLNGNVDAPTYNIEDILALVDDKEYSTYSFEHSNMFITSGYSHANNWNYYLVQPYDAAFSSLVAYRNTFTFITAIAFLLGLVMILFLSEKNAKPLMELNFELTETKRQHTSLQTELEQQRPVIFASYIERIMLGKIYSNEEFDYVANFLAVNETSKKFFVLYMCVYNNPDDMFSEENITGEIDAFETNALIERDELIKDKIYNYYGQDTLIYTPCEDTYAILLRSDKTITGEVSFSSVTDSFIKLHNDLLSNHSMWVYAGIGNRNEELMYTWKSYQQAKEAIQYTGKDNIIQPYMTINKNKTTYYFPLELASQLTTFINNGNIDQTSEIFNLLYKENFVDRALPLQVVKWFFSDLRNILLKVRFGIKTTPNNEDMLNKIDDLFAEHKTFDLLKDIALKLCNLNDTKPEGNQLIATIKTYIKDNYKDASLCLNKISDEFGISESYFSYLFKAETNQNFSEYLESIRMEQAVDLLKNSDINISDLYLELGYNNANSFRRAFKKVYGVSPKTMRDSKVS